MVDGVLEIAIGEGPFTFCIYVREIGGEIMVVERNGHVVEHYANAPRLLEKIRKAFDKTTDLSKAKLPKI